MKRNLRANVDLWAPSELGASAGDRVRLTACLQVGAVVGAVVVATDEDDVAVVNVTVGVNSLMPAPGDVLPVRGMLVIDAHEIAAGCGSLVVVELVRLKDAAEPAVVRATLIARAGA